MQNPQDHDRPHSHGCCKHCKGRLGHVSVVFRRPRAEGTPSTHSQVTQGTQCAWQGVCGQRNKDGEAKSCESSRGSLECSFILPLVRTFIEGTSHTPCATWLEPTCFDPAEHSQATAETALFLLLQTPPCGSCRSTTMHCRSEQQTAQCHWDMFMRIKTSSHCKDSSFPSARPSKFQSTEAPCAKPGSRPGNVISDSRRSCVDSIELWHTYLLSGLTAEVSQHNVDSVALILAGMRHAR